MNCPRRFASCLTSARLTNFLHTHLTKKATEGAPPFASLAKGGFHPQLLIPQSHLHAPALKPP